MVRKIKPAILLSIFNRKGGESKLTKIVFGNNTIIEQLPVDLFEDEIPIILSNAELGNFYLLTDKRIFFKLEGSLSSYTLASLKESNFALKEKREPKIDKIKLVFEEGTLILSVEEGKPFQGIYQIMSFLA